MEKSVVSIVKGTELDEMVEKALAHFGGVKAIIKANSTVVVKPNAGHMGGPDTSVNTSPEVVAAVIKAIQKANPKKLILAESSAMGCKTIFLTTGKEDPKDVKNWETKPDYIKRDLKEAVEWVLKQGRR